MQVYRLLRFQGALQYNFNELGMLSQGSGQLEADAWIFLG